MNEEEFEEDFGDYPEEEETCEFGSEGCLIADAMYVLEMRGMSKKNKMLDWIVFHTGRLGRVLFRNRFYELEQLCQTAFGLPVVEHCSFTCPNRGMWMHYNTPYEDPGTSLREQF